MIGGGSAIEMSHPFYIQTCLALDKLVSLVCGVVVGTSGSLCRFCGEEDMPLSPGWMPSIWAGAQQDQLTFLQRALTDRFMHHLKGIQWLKMKICVQIILSLAKKLNSMNAE